MDIKSLDKLFRKEINKEMHLTIFFTKKDAVSFTKNIINQIRNGKFILPFPSNFKVNAEKQESKISEVINYLDQYNKNKLVAQSCYIDIWLPKKEYRTLSIREWESITNKEKIYTVYWGL